MDGKKSLLEKILQVQQDLKAPKNQYNSFWNYKYRSCEDILQAARPLCNANGLILTLRDSVEMIGERYYIKAESVVTDVDSGETFVTNAMAREAEAKKGMDAAQVTGASSSYARKYALCALFAIDDTKDADTDEYQRKEKGNQSAQQAAGAPKSKQVSNPPADEKKAVLQRLTADMKQNGMGGDEMRMLLQKRYNKESSKELTLAEARDLAQNYMKYWDELMQQLGQEGAA